MNIVLASTSPYRRRLLQRLQIDFIADSPQTDETHLPGEPPDARALRLAEEKAASLAARYPRHLIIGGDQTICGDGIIFDKPMTRPRAVAQLKKMRGKTVSFFTAVAVLDSATDNMRRELTAHRARLREAGDEEIERYADKENAFDCAGGAQIEGLGISLLEEIEGGDPAALVGLPLMTLSAMLRAHGLRIP